MARICNPGLINIKIKTYEYPTNQNRTKRIVTSTGKPDQHQRDNKSKHDNKPLSEVS
jgi:hypothetical protein